MVSNHSHCTRMMISRSFACLLLSLALLSLAAAGCRPAISQSAPPPPAVTVNLPVQKEIVEWDEYQGWLNPVDMVEVRARVSGYLESIHFKEGAIVNKGDLLFVIDPRPYEAELAREQAALNQAETRLEL